MCEQVVRHHRKQVTTPGRQRTLSEMEFLKAEQMNFACASYVEQDIKFFTILGYIHYLSKLFIDHKRQQSDASNLHVPAIVWFGGELGDGVNILSFAYTSHEWSHPLEVIVTLCRTRPSRLHQST